MGRAGLILGPVLDPPHVYAELKLRPSVSSLDSARRFAPARVTANFDTGMQRFGCDREALETFAEEPNVVELMTHARDVSSISQLCDAARGRSWRRHAAASALLERPEAWLDAVRPGVALYRSAVTVTTALAEVRNAAGPIGYTGFRNPRVGILLMGYSQGLRPGPVLINGQRQFILEVGMNSSFVSAAPHDRVGDRVTLLGEGLSERELAQVWGVREHEILCTLCGMGPIGYREATGARIVEARPRAAASLSAERRAG